MSEVVLIVEQAVTPGLEQEAHDAIRGLCEAVHAHDEGVVLYAAYDVDGDPGRIVAIERWDSQEALETHAAKAHVTALASVSALAGPPTVTVLRALRYGDPVKGAL